MFQDRNFYIDFKSNKPKNPASVYKYSTSLLEPAGKEAKVAQLVLGRLSCPSPLHNRAFVCLPAGLTIVLGRWKPSSFSTLLWCCSSPTGDGCTRGGWGEYSAICTQPEPSQSIAWAALGCGQKKGPWLEESFRCGEQTRRCDKIREAVTCSNYSWWGRVTWWGVGFGTYLQIGNDSDVQMLQIFAATLRMTLHFLTCNGIGWGY